MEYFTYPFYLPLIVKKSDRTTLNVTDKIFVQSAELQPFLWDFPVTNLLLPFQNPVFNVDMKEAQPLNLILTSPDRGNFLHTLNPNVNIYVSCASLFLFNSTVNSRSCHRGRQGNKMLIMQHTPKLIHVQWAMPLLTSPLRSEIVQSINKPSFYYFFPQYFMIFRRAGCLTRSKLPQPCCFFSPWREGPRDLSAWGSLFLCFY